MVNLLAEWILFGRSTRAIPIGPHGVATGRGVLMVENVLDLVLGDIGVVIG